MSVERPQVAGRARRAAGFTLIELMVTIALVAVVAAVAYPSYVVSVQKARRADARVALTQTAQQLERYYTENNQYTGARFCNSGDAGCTAFNQVHSLYSENGHYLLSFDSRTRTLATYTLLAVPQDAQSTDPCGTFTLNERGERRVRDGTQTDATQCW